MSKRRKNHPVPRAPRPLVAELASLRKQAVSLQADLEALQQATRAGRGGANALAHIAETLGERAESDQSEHVHDVCRELAERITYWLKARGEQTTYLLRNASAANNRLGENLDRMASLQSRQTQALASLELGLARLELEAMGR